MIGLLVWLIVIGALLGLVEANYIPMPAWMKMVIRVVCIIAVVLLLAYGLLPLLPPWPGHYPPPR
jgi:peptidoglycan/LPS O-acetylase OafA/YrhL